MPGKFRKCIFKFHPISFILVRIMQKSVLHRLKSRLSQPLPGWKAHAELSPVYHERYKSQPDGHLKAAVLALLFPGKDENLNLVYIKRPSHNPHDKHGGQISFPGGKLDKSDASLKATATRETEEEIGIPRDSIEIIGRLSDIYVYVSNFLITPYVGYIDYYPSFVIQESEVDYTIEVPLQKIINPDNLKLRNMNIRGFRVHKVPYFDIDGEVLWGASAMITNELIQVLKYGM